MKRLITALVVAFLAVPAAALAQDGEGFGPPAGFEGMSGASAGFGANFSEKSGEGENGAEMERRGQEAEARGKEMANKGLERMKKGTKSMRKAIGQMNKVVAQVKKAGYSVPEEVAASLAKAVAAVELINSASEFTDEVQTAMEDFNEFVDVLDDKMQGLQVLARFPKILEKATREITNASKLFERTKAKLEKVEMDLTDSFAKVQASIDALRTIYDKAVTAATASDADDAFAILEDEFFPSVNDVRESIGVLNALRNIARTIKSVEKGIKNMEKITAKVQKKGADVSAPQAVIDASRAELENLKASLKSPDFDPTGAVDYLDTLSDLRDQFEETLNEIIEDNEINVKVNSVKFFGGKEVKPPKEMKDGFGGKGNGNTVKKLDF